MRSVNIEVRSAANEIFSQCVRLAIQLGCFQDEIVGAVLDSIHNQCLKASSKIDHTIFPSRWDEPSAARDIAEEAADVGLVMRDLMYVTQAAALPSLEGLTDMQVGQFIDSKAGKKRTAQAVAGRLIEEGAELCLAAGASPADITRRAVASAESKPLMNSTSAVRGRHIYSLARALSQQVGSDFDAGQIRKFRVFSQKQHVVSPNGCLYAIKGHVRGASTTQTPSAPAVA